MGIFQMFRKVNSKKKLFISHLNFVLYTVVTKTNGHLSTKFQTLKEGCKGRTLTRNVAVNVFMLLVCGKLSNSGVDLR